MISQTHSGLRLARKRLGLSQKQLGFLLGEDQALIVRYEQGKRVPSVTSLIRLSLLFDQPIEHLLLDVWNEQSEDLRALMTSLKYDLQAGEQTMQSRTIETNLNRVLARLPVPHRND